MQTDVQVSDVARETSCSDNVRRREKKADEISKARRTLNRSSIYNWDSIQESGEPSILASSPSQELAMTVREAGKKGGLSCLRNRGKEFFSEIGKAGQQAMRGKYPGMAGEWGRRGGRPRKRSLADIMGETKK
jgi:general stress protein YciG